MKIKQFFSEFAKYNSFLFADKKARFNLQKFKLALNWQQAPAKITFKDPQIMWNKGLREVGL